MRQFSTFKTLALTAIAPLVWGSTYIVTTETLPPDSPLLAAAIRALPAGLLLVLLTRTWPSISWGLKLISLGILNISLFFYCLFFAATHLPGNMAALLMAVQPMVVMLLSGLLLNTRIRPQQVFAGVVGISGIALLVLNSAVQLNIEGVLAALLGTLSMALGVVLTKKWGRPDNMSMLGFTGWQLLFGGLVLLPIALWAEGLPAFITAKNIAGYAYLSVIGGILSYWLWFRGIEKLPPVSVSFLSLLSSFSACILGYLFLNQTLTLLQAAGGVAILLSILLASPRPATNTQTTTNKTIHPMRTH